MTPSLGWGVLHLYYRVDRARADGDAAAGKHIVDAIAALEADGHQALCLAMLGHKADLGVIALGPDLARLQRFQQELLAAPIEPVWSYVSLTELSEYGATEGEERARLVAEENVAGEALEERLAAWRERIAHYRENRIHPRLPMKRCACFYPMSKRRAAGANWFELTFEERKELMAGHARVGRTLRGPRAPAHHGLDRDRRLGVGRDVARRRSGGTQRDRLRDALRSGLRSLRRLRPLLHGPRPLARGRVRARVGLRAEGDAR